MKIPKLSKETSLFNKNKTVETSFKLLADSITSIVTGQETYTDPDGNTQTNAMGTMIRQTLNNVIIQATKESNDAAQAGAALITSLINVATDGITISSDKVNIEGAAIFSSGRLSQNSLDETYSSTDEVQYIYIQAVSGTNSISGTTTWITATGESTASNNTGLTPTWTTKRPTYRSNYPVIFTAKQTKTISGTVTCTTPVKDDTLTVIDGDHITTGTIDASKVNVSNLSANSITTGTLDGSKANITNINASNISTGTLDLSRLDVMTKVDDDGIKVHAHNNPTTNYVGIDASGLNVIKNSISVARFGETARIGKLLKGYIEIGTNTNDNGYIDMYNSNVLLCHIGYDAGTNASGGTSVAPYYDLGLRKLNSTIGNYSMSEGNLTEASGYASHAEGYETTASGGNSHAEGRKTKATDWYSHAEGYLTTASGKYGSHAEGYETTASGWYSHAEGYQAKASSEYCHAEGYKTTARGYYASSHAEGYETTASGEYGSHAEGYQTTASGTSSHASGSNTIAGSANQFVCGKYNSNSSFNLFEIGNGSKDARANAFQVTTSNTAYMGSTAVTSDRRIKTDLGELNSSQAIDFIKELIPHKYEKFGRKELGFFAQDVEKDPNYGNILVEQYEDHGYKDFRSLSYDGLIAPIVSVEQNLIERVEKLEKENAELKEQIEQLIQIVENSK